MISKGAQRTRKSKTATPYRLRLERLEDRMLLATFVVDSAADTSDINPGDGICSDAASGGVCTLRAAIQETEALANVGGPDVVHFSIGGTGVHTIHVANPLPSIDDPLIIDGYTQDSGTADPLDDAKPNTLTGATNAVLLIEIDGTFAPIDGTGLTITAGNSTVRGLVINRFPNDGDGIRLTTNGGNLIAGNFIGTSANGLQALGNDDGITVDGSPNNTIGGTAPADRNLISGNRDDGIEFLNDADGNLVQGNLIGTNAAGTGSLGNVNEGLQISTTGNTIGGSTPGARNLISGNFANGVELHANGNLIQGNFIGTDVTGTQPLSNTLDGVLVETAGGNTVGGTASGAANIIAFNGANGVSVGTAPSDSSFRNVVLRNSIFSNTDLGIDLADDGQTNNDAGDADTGPNDLQNFPEFSTATLASGSLTVTYNVTSDPAESGYPLRVEFFKADVAGQEGQTFLGSDTFTAADFAAGGKTVTFTPAAAVVNGDRIVATATDSVNATPANTSEFSLPATVQAVGCSLVVDTQLDVVSAVDGVNSLREAIICANITPGPDIINVPAGTYTLTIGGAGEDAAATGDLDITDDLTIQRVAGQVNPVIIQAGTLGPNDPGGPNGIDRVFDVPDLSDITRVVNVSLIDLTVQHGDTTANGGGIQFATLGMLTVTRVTVTDNHDGQFGGGIFNRRGNMTIDDSTISNNRSDSDGGGIDSSLSGSSFVTVTNCTISDNVAVGDGGGIFNDVNGFFAVTNSSVTGNSAENGGGIFSASILRVLADSVVDGNSAGNQGGGIFSSGMLTINQSAVSNNNSVGNGGGIFNDHGHAELNNATIAGNRTHDDGGGIYSDGSPSGTTLIIKNSQISTNAAGIVDGVGDGGGIFNANDNVTIENTTLNNNQAANDGGGIATRAGPVADTTLDVHESVLFNNIAGAEGSGNGGAIFNDGDTITLSNVTISGNSASNEGGGIYQGVTFVGSTELTHVTIHDNTALEGSNLFSDGVGPIMLANTIVSSGNDGSNCNDPSLFTSLGHNLEDTDTCGFDTAAPKLDKINTDPQLGSLADNGGPTLTHLPASTSPAIDMGDNAQSLPIDQRGIARPQPPGGIVDIGAVEVIPPVADVVLTKSDSPDPVSVGQNVTYTIDVTNNGPDTASVVTVTDTLPLGTTLVSAIPSKGTCSSAPGIVTCDLGMLAVGAVNAATITIIVTAPDTPGQITNTVSSTAAETDSNPANNTNIMQTTQVVLPEADIVLTKSDSPDPVLVGQDVTYTVTVTNNGPATASAVTVTDTLPPGTTLISAIPSNGTCSGTTSTVTCDLGVLAVGPANAATITIIVTAPDTPGPITNTVSSTANETDPIAANNTNITQTTDVVTCSLVVTTTADTDDPTDSVNSLREAINCANSDPDLSTITFDIPGVGVQTINVSDTGLGALPEIIFPVIIDGYTQGQGTPTTADDAKPNTLAVGNNAVLLIELNGSNTTGTDNGLLLSAGGSTIRGLVINRFANDGIRLIPGAQTNGGSNVIEGNFIGTDPTGTLDLGNGDDGIDVRVPSNTIGGATPAARNLISGNGDSGDGEGIYLFGPAASGNRIQNNYVGTNAAGTAALGNADDGIDLDSASNNVIIGNVVSGNGDDGVEFDGGNDIDQGDATGNLLQGNFIGTNAAGTAAIPNASDGVSIQNASMNTVGGTTAAARNVISGNSFDGVFLEDSGATGNLIQGNFIGVDVTGRVDLGNRLNGVNMEGANSNTVGGAAAGAANVISGNDEFGVNLDTANFNRVLNNFIGTDLTSALDLHNDTGGVNIQDGNNNTIQSNTIWFNLSDTGIAVFLGTSNELRANSIFKNEGLGIDLGDDGVTPNDLSPPCPANQPDCDSGPNGLQNFPVLTSAVTTNGVTIIHGSLDSTPLSSFRIEFFVSTEADPSGFGEGEIFTGDITRTTNSAGHVEFDFSPATPIPVGRFVTATATSLPADGTSPNSDIAGEGVTPQGITGETNTSEFSAAIQVAGGEGAAADLQVQKTDSPDPAPVGEDLTYTILVTNNGPDDATNVSITDQLPANVEFVSIHTTDGTCSIVDRVVTCDFGDIPASTGSNTRTVTIVVQPLEEGTQLTNQVTVVADQNDPFPNNNTSSASTTVPEGGGGGGGGRCTSDNLGSREGSGNVTARVSQGKLLIRGDGQQNNILIEAGRRRGSLRISGRDDTTVNGSTHSVELRDFVDVSIAMGAGSDVVAIVDALLENGLRVKMQAQDDDLILCGVEVQGRTRTGEGRGRDKVSVDDSTFHDDTHLGTGRGADDVQIERNGKKNGPRTEFKKRLKIRTEEGNDKIKIGRDERGNSVDADGCTKVRGGKGHDVFDASLDSHINEFKCGPKLKSIEEAK